jgi:hypothetical protein
MAEAALRDAKVLARNMAGGRYEAAIPASVIEEMRRVAATGRLPDSPTGAARAQAPAVAGSTAVLSLPHAMAEGAQGSPNAVVTLAKVLPAAVAAGEAGLGLLVPLAINVIAVV